MNPDRTSSAPGSHGDGGPGLIHVLLIEDNPRDAELITRHLARDRAPGFKLTIAATLSAAHSVAEKGCDAILLDLSLPDSCGLGSLLEMTRALPHLPIVVLTGLDQESTAVEAIRHGAQDYLVKHGEDNGLLRRSLRFAIERKAFELRLCARAHYDQLTGLANRALFEDRLENALARARRAGGRIALMFIDLDGFKAINDSLGHDAGDEVLRRVAAKLRSAVRDSDTVARHGGDEFTILLDPASDTETIAGAAGRVLDSLHQPFCILENHVCTTPSIGIAVFPDHADNSADLLRRADIAMYQAKKRGRNRFQFGELE